MHVIMDDTTLQKEEKGFDHQEAIMPSVPDPEVVTNILTSDQLCFNLINLHSLYIAA